MAFAGAVDDSWTGLEGASGREDVKKFAIRIKGIIRAMCTKRTAMKLSFLAMILIALWGLSGCKSAALPTATPTAAAPTETPLPPTPTPVPAALMVNGEPVLQMVYDAWLAAYQVSQPAGADEDARQAVLDELVNQALLAQGAAAGGYTVSEADLDARLQQAAESAGGEQALTEWQTQNGFDTASFREALRLSMAAAWQRDHIAASVPMEVEQVHARQLLLLDEDTANLYLGQLEAGADFATIAKIVDPILGGDLNWFPRGYLTQPTVEEAAFALEPGQTSDIVQSDLGYHIIQVLERETHPLTPEARNFLQHKAVQDWLDEQRAKSEIEILLP
jgi:parvulin-like peptidyl-prolyl isomerase